MKKCLCYLLLFVSICLLIKPTVTNANDAPLDIILRQYASKRDLSDWEAIVLGVNGVKIKTPLFTTPYFKRLEKEIVEKKGEYRLATDYARIVLVNNSNGKSTTNIAGYDFIDKIENFPHMRNQGINAYCWSLIALYGQDATVTQSLVDSILPYQTFLGGFSATLASSENDETKIKPDADLTAMAITALAPYASNETVRLAVDKAVVYLSVVQEPDGTFKANGVSNAESVAQVIIALCAYGIDANDERFIKNGCSVLDALDTFKCKDSTYAHISNGKADPIATRQAALALSAYRKAMRYQNMTEAERTATGLRKGIFEI